MQVGVLQMLELETGGACAATIFLLTVRAVEILGVGERQLQLTDTGYAGKQLRVGYAALTHRLTKLLLRGFLSYDVCK